MSTTLKELVRRHRRAGILVDSNLLLLLLVGAYRKELISRFKRTDRFAVEDFQILLSFLDLFEEVVTTPNVLTEVSNLANQLPENEKAGFYKAFHFLAANWNERFLPSIDLLANAELRVLGLTDVAISVAGQSPVLVLTDDFRLAGKLRQAGVDVINFNHLRTYF